MGSDETLRLRDGRMLSYGAWGPRDGIPVFGFHGAGLSRLQHYGEDAPAVAGVRLVLPDRPGCGRSDSSPAATLQDEANDVEELADALGFGRFAVFGVSAGGPLAAACGYWLADHVPAVGLVSAVGPYVDEPTLVLHLRPDARALVELARCDPAAAEEAAAGQCRAESELIAHDPEAFLDAWPPGTPESDRELMADPAIRSRFVAALRDTACRGSDGILLDTLLAYVKPWGFRLADMTAPTRVWHGDRDPFVSIEIARIVAGLLPNARLTVCGGEGHGVDRRHIDEILADLTASVV